jgi:hypothetical protein
MIKEVSLSRVDDLLQRQVRHLRSAFGTFVEHEISHCSAIVRHVHVRCSHSVLVDFTKLYKAAAGRMGLMNGWINSNSAAGGRAGNR